LCGGVHLGAGKRHTLKRLIFYGADCGRRRQMKKQKTCRVNVGMRRRRGGWEKGGTFGLRAHRAAQRQARLLPWAAMAWIFAFHPLLRKAHFARRAGASVAFSRHSRAARFGEVWHGGTTKLGILYAREGENVGSIWLNKDGIM
jgi:hypothetical protein